MRLAYFQPHDGRVLQWIDTEAHSYNLPDASMLHQCTEEEWTLRAAGDWMVKDGAVAPYVEPTKTVNELRAEKSAELDAACREQIYAGFDCDALGVPHHYPAKDKDQSNLAGSVLDSVLAGDDPTYTTPFWCADQAGVWDFRLHTASEIQTVGRTAKAAILAALSHNAALQAQVAAATTEAELAAIAW